MKPYPKTMTTISRKGDKIVVIRKPVFPTWRAKFFRFFWAVLIFIIVIRVAFVFLYFNVDPELADVFLVTVCIAVFGIISYWVIRKKWSQWREAKTAIPVESWVETIIFETNMFSLQEFGNSSTSSFSYRFDSRPVLRPNPVWPNLMDILIPCIPLDDYVSLAFQWGFCGIWFVDAADAERILAALKEHLATIGENTGK